MYVDNGTAKVPISAKIGVQVQGLTFGIWNNPKVGAELVTSLDDSI